VLGGAGDLVVLDPESARSAIRDELAADAGALASAA